MSVEKTKISHSELEMAASIALPKHVPQSVRERLAFFRDIDIARANLDASYPDGEQNDDLAMQLAWTLVSERSRRNAHFYRYRLMTKAALLGSLLDDDVSLPEASLLDLEKRTSVMTDADWTMAAAYTGKGISAELGHVDQLGDWDAGHQLDDAIRKLPSSEALESAGFIFGDTYDSKDTARISYDFYISDGGLKAKRKRAAADVITENGAIYNLVKTSTFLINERDLSDEDMRRVRAVKRSFKEGDMTLAEVQAQDAAFAEAGTVIIEPFISEKERRERSTAVLAATSLYFALVRHR